MRIALRNSIRPKILSTTVAAAISLVLFLVAGSSGTLRAQPAAPTLLTPLNNATNVPNTVMLRWTEPVGATRYNVEVATDAQLTNKILQVNVPAGHVSFTAPTQGMTYYWRVNAVNAGGQRSPYSARFHFTTEVTIPAAPTLLTPLNNATDVPLTVMLRWKESAGATRYNVEVATDSELKNKILQENVPGGHMEFTAPSQGTYYWRVNAVGPGGRSPYSMRFHFTTVIIQPGKPALIAPANGAADVPSPVTLEWSAADNAESYDVAVYTDSMMQGQVFNANTTGLTASFNAPVAGDTYWWHVAANAQGASTASDLWMFSTSATVGSLVPHSLVPEDGAVNVPIDPLMMWSAPDPDSTSSYHLQIATDASFDSLVVDVDSIDATSYQVMGLAYETMYSWRVAGVDAVGNETFSPSQSFTTIDSLTASIGIPTLVSPADGTQGASAYEELSWSAVDGATRYHVQVATDDIFENLVVNDTMVTGTSFVTPAPYAYETTHYWRVRAGTDETFGLLSEEWSFTTATGVANESDELPSELALDQNYPNPFNPATRIKYALPEAGHVTISVYDALGRPVSTLVDGRMPAGNHTVTWSGESLVSGVYFYRMEVGDFVEVRRMTLLK